MEALLECDWTCITRVHDPRHILLHANEVAAHHYVKLGNLARDYGQSGRFVESAPLMPMTGGEAASPILAQDYYMQTNPTRVWCRACYKRCLRQRFSQSSPGLS